MLVRDAMSTVVLTTGPARTLRQVAALMSTRRVGAAVALDPDGTGTGTGILDSLGLGLGQDPNSERAHSRTTTDVVFATPSWTLEDAAHAMAHGGFRHLIVLERGEPVGIISVRDIIRCWAPARQQAAQRATAQRQAVQRWNQPRRAWTAASSRLPKYFSLAKASTDPTMDSV